MRKKFLKSIIKHLSLMFCLSVGILYVLFYVALPYITNQGKFVQVPDITGIAPGALDEYLSKHHLRYVITDNFGYSAQLPPFTVLQQFPAAGAFVKQNRKIYLTLNAENPPPIPMPNLIDGSVKQAQLLLHDRGLILGNITYVPDITQYNVLEQWYNGKPIPAGKLIIQGSTIDVVVGAGLGKQTIEVPDVLDIPLEEASLVLLERGMRTGITHRVKDKAATIGHIIRQNPLPGTKVRLGTSINLWVVSL